MLNTTDFEKLWFLYKMEGEPRNVSVEDFCERRGVNAEVFRKWLRGRQKKIVPVEITGRPEDAPADKAAGENSETAAAPKDVVNAVKSVNIVLRGGTLIAKRNLSYQGLKELVEKAEALC